MSKYNVGDLISQRLEDGVSYQLQVVKVFQDEPVKKFDKNDIVEFLKTKPDGASPTEIGEAFGKSYAQASSWACTKLKSLVEAGKVNKISGRKYTVSGL